MKISERIQKIQELQDLKVPWEVTRVVGPVSLFGAQVHIGEDSDIVTVKEARQAITWLVNELGGTVKWGKNDKNS